VVDWQLEQAYLHLNTEADHRAASLAPQENQAHKWSKDGHLQQIEQSGLFRYSREIVFHHHETFDADRYVNLALSQGGLQTAVKLGATDLLTIADEFRQLAARIFAGESREVLFSYRMRLGIV
jgi:hypothetical protein